MNKRNRTPNTHRKQLKDVFRCFKQKAAFQESVRQRQKELSLLATKKKVPCYTLNGQSNITT